MRRPRTDRRHAPRTALLGAISCIVILSGAVGCDDGQRSSGGGRQRAGETQALAERLEADGDRANALTTYRDATRRYPTESWPWAGLGRVSEEMGRFRDAEGAYRTAVRWDSTRADVCAGLARLLREDKRSEEALGWVDQALRRGSTTSESSALRARILAELGRHGEARKVVDRAIAANPQSVAARTASVYCRLAADERGPALAELDALGLSGADSPAIDEARAHVLTVFGDTDGAIESLKQVVAKDPNRPIARRSLASLLLSAERIPEATEVFRSLLENDPRSPFALEGLGRCAHAAGDETAAEEAFQRALEADPEYAQAYLALGRLVASKGRGDEAVGLLRKARARAREPQVREQCSLALGETYLLLGEADHALEVADTILLRRPESEAGRALRGRALAADGAGARSGEELERLASRPGATREEILGFTEWLLSRGESDRALRLVDVFLSTAPADVDGRVLRARALVGTGETEIAESSLHELLAISEESAPVRLALARLYLAERRFPDAIFHASEGEILDPRDPQFPVVRGLAAIELGNLDDARAAFERERDLNPQRPEAWIHLGKVEMQLGRPAAAAVCFQNARELDPEDWGPAYLLGLAEAEAGRPQEAIKAYRTALTQNERLVEAHNNLAWLLADLDLDPVLAEVHARRAAELSPQDPNVLGTLGWAQYKNRLLDDAATTLASAVLIVPDDALKRYMLGVVEFHRGHREEARIALAAALEHDPGFTRAQQARDLLNRLD